MNDYKVLIDVLKIRSEYSRDGSFWNEAVANDIDRAIDAIEQLVRERDEAIADLKEICMERYWPAACDYCNKHGKQVCKHCDWEWRGVQE